MLKNTKDEYGSLSKAFHWITAALVIALLAVGLTMGDFSGTAKLTAYNLHKSFGITVLALTVCRLCWHSMSPKPGAADALTPRERKAVTVLHALFYILLIALPLSGWLMSSAAGRTVSFFWLFPLPDLVSPDKPVAEFFNETHEILANLMIVAVGLHIAAALKHHFINKDALLKRMLPALAAILLAAPSPSLAADMQKWHVQLDKSSITFRPKQMGTEFTGTFDLFASDIVFDPDNLAASKAVVAIDASKANTRTADRDETLKGAEWFDVTKFPVAKFETTAFRKTGDGLYEADAALTIRDVTLPVTLPFSLRIDKDDKGDKTATVDGHIVLERLKFGLGSGQWADISVIANEVPVDIHLVAGLIRPRSAISK